MDIDELISSNVNKVNEDRLFTNEEYEDYFSRELEKHKNDIRCESKVGYEVFRRFIDIVFSLCAIIPVTILIIILSLIIRLDSPGNPIFTQVRVGKNGKLMKIHKLRSMNMNAEANGQKWAEDDDPRITKIGRILRKYRLDEIPQFYDVLTGKLSLIGPRPEVPVLTKQFNEETPGFVTRLLVRPGLSGYAQVNGGYDIDYKEKWEKDNYYIEHRSIKLYIHIFFRTLGVVSTGEGAK
ncbi:MAG: sugar transferase [Erysipelotrichaceae bacterium]|nr:sugar transferase [Erysipelotrichaceae bacterium]